MAIGICQKIMDGREIAVVRYPDGIEIEVLSNTYRLNGYSPPFDELPECTANQGGLNVGEEPLSR